MKIAMGILATLVMTFGLSVFAQEGKGACKEDIQKFCSGIEKGGGKIAKCLKEHSSELSEGCKEHAAQAKEKMKEVKEACSADMAKFCSGVKAGGGRIRKCMVEHKDELSEGCKAEFKTRKK